MNKRLIGILTALLIALSLAPAHGQGGTGYDPRKDWNGDGVLDIRDVTDATRYTDELARYIQANYGATRVVPVTTTAQPTVTPATATVSPSATPKPATATPATVTPSPTPHTHAGLNPCGLPLDAWWTATEPNGCQNKSERGDAPPTWVKDYEVSRGRVMSMHGPNLTGAAEANQKYMVMKGYAFTVPVVRPRAVNVDIYCVIHGGSVPFERAGKVHSWRCWFKEGDNGNISAIQGWYRAPGFAFERIVGFDSTPNRNNFPIIFAPSRASAAAGGGGCEQWYVGAPGREPNIEFGITFCGVVAFLKPNETALDYDVSKWDLSGSKGTQRRLEISYYKVTRADNQKTGIYWATQAGVPVSGPTDPACKAFVTIAGSNYPAICLEQNVSPTLPEISFNSTNGRNAFDRTYPSTGVQAPN
jgi:hypothetical protein